MFDLSKLQKRERYIRFFYNWYIKEERPKLLEVPEEFYLPAKCRDIEIKFNGKGIDNSVWPPTLKVNLQVPNIDRWYPEPYYYPTLYIYDDVGKAELCKWILMYMGFEDHWSESVFRRIRRIVNDFMAVEKSLPGYDIKFDEIPEGSLR